MPTQIVRVADVIKHPNADRLTINILSNGLRCLSNLNDEGQPRYKAGDFVAHVPCGAVVPEWLLRRQDAWNEETGKGYLGGEAGNVVGVFKARGEKSYGMLVAGTQKIRDEALSVGQFGFDVRTGPCLDLSNNTMTATFFDGQNVAAFLGVKDPESESEAFVFK